MHWKQIVTLLNPNEIYTGGSQTPRLLPTAHEGLRMWAGFSRLGWDPFGLLNRQDPKKASSSQTTSASQEVSCVAE